jgi:hypothetical protein
VLAAADRIKITSQRGIALNKPGAQQGRPGEIDHQREIKNAFGQQEPECPVGQGCVRRR